MNPSETRVWDPFVRIFHWLLVLGFAVSYLSEGEPLALHVWSGYLIGGLILLRVVWGFVGPEHARFSDFVYSPVRFAAYIRDLVLHRAPRYIGHSPAGGAMIVLLLLSLAGTVGTGLVLYAQEKNAGPLAGWVGVTATAPAPGAAVAPAVAPAAREDDEDEGRGEKEESAVAELHELLANFTLLLVFAHIGGVVLASFAHHENLPWAMITGSKRP